MGANERVESAERAEGAVEINGEGGGEVSCAAKVTASYRELAQRVDRQGCPERGFWCPASRLAVRDG